MTDQPAAVSVESIAAILDQLTNAAAQRVIEHLAENGPMASPWMSTSEAAAYLRVKPKRLYDLKALGELRPAGGNGSRLLYARADLDAWARSQASEEEALQR